MPNVVRKLPIEQDRAVGDTVSDQALSLAPGAIALAQGVDHAGFAPRCRHRAEADAAAGHAAEGVVGYIDFIEVGGGDVDLRTVGQRSQAIAVTRWDS